MCRVLLLGSDTEVFTSKWEAQNPQFCVEELSPSCYEATKYFSKSYVYYLNSSEGCGCGFEIDIEHESKEIEEYKIEWRKCSNGLRKEIGRSPEDELLEFARKKQGCEDLVNLIKRLLGYTNELEIYAVLNDPDQNKKPTKLKTITPNEIFVDGKFNLFPKNDSERILYKVRNRT